MKTKEEIEFTVNQALQSTNSASIYFQQPEIGELKVEIEKGEWYCITKNEIQTREESIRFEVDKQFPFICLFFQIKGSSNFADYPAAQIPEKHHSLNYLPDFKSQYVVGKNKYLQDMSIKITPEALADKLLGNDIPEERWQQLIKDKEPYVTLHDSKKMNPVIWDTLFQLLHCPYSGSVAKMYKELLIRMLFIHQIMSFRQPTGKALPTIDTKLHKRDIEVLHAIKEYLELHYLDDLSLDAIVKEFGINTFKLKYGFKKLFGMPVMKFIDDKKMAYAKQLLLDRHTEVMDIAERLGYNHYNNFSAAFKRKYGYSPAFFVEKEEYIAHI
ncbi:AraC family transcriptional regulator [Rhodocytophaga aerolata]|uniref:AraC family transcriptional regulator n=1 Tax=Rhodocytophaga aerolata TaxID=455078 RepID=A0ABT8R810_9BACT|nr:AraC family transcriptional regulator [Rhodocytophaga aerolata]MDO1448230.1 AraC family transcriptional regulator [Rhodocytophaga aerolata]